MHLQGHLSGKKWKLTGDSFLKKKINAYWLLYPVHVYLSHKNIMSPIKIKSSEFFPNKISLA